MHIITEIAMNVHQITIFYTINCCIFNNVILSVCFIKFEGNPLTMLQTSLSLTDELKSTIHRRKSPAFAGYCLQNSHNFLLNLQECLIDKNCHCT